MEFLFGEDGVRVDYFIFLNGMFCFLGFNSFLIGIVWGLFGILGKVRFFFDGVFGRVIGMRFWLVELFVDIGFEFGVIIFGGFVFCGCNVL